MRRLVPLVALASLAAAGCAPRAAVRLEGRTMGTTYHVTVVTGGSGSVEGLQVEIDRRLGEINRSLATWIGGRDDLLRV